MSVTSDDPPIGPPVPGWSTRQLPPLVAMSGRFCRVEPIDSTRHGAALCAAYATDREGRLWTYLPWGPYSGPEELCARIDAVRASGVRPEYALIDLSSSKPFGQASYLNIDPAAGSIEVGGIVYAPEIPTWDCRDPSGDFSILYRKAGRCRGVCSAMFRKSRAFVPRYQKFESICRPTGCLEGVVQHLQMLHGQFRVKQRKPGQIAPPVGVCSRPGRPSPDHQRLRTRSESSWSPSQRQRSAGSISRLAKAPGKLRERLGIAPFPPEWR